MKPWQPCGKLRRENQGAQVLGGQSGQLAWQHEENASRSLLALIEEAHKHGMIVHAHATNLEDQKGVVKAGVDVLVHTLMAEKVDDEFIAILKAKRPYWTP